MRESYPQTVTIGVTLGVVAGGAAALVAATSAGPGPHFMQSLANSTGGEAAVQIICTLLGAVAGGLVGAAQASLAYWAVHWSARQFHGPLAYAAALGAALSIVNLLLTSMFCAYWFDGQVGWALFIAFVATGLAVAGFARVHAADWPERDLLVTLSAEAPSSRRGQRPSEPVLDLTAGRTEADREEASWPARR